MTATLDTRRRGMLRAAASMTGSALAFAIMTVIVRRLSADLHPFELAFFRNLFGFLFVLPWLARIGIGSLRTRRLGLHVVRAACGMTAMLCLFTAISLIPLAEATAITFAAPVFATAGAALLLGERVRAHRWTATIVGFFGTTIVLRPGADMLSSGSLTALAAALFMAGAVLVIKSLAKTEHPTAIVWYFGLFVTPLSLIPALFVWTPPTLDHWPWLVALGLFATVGQLLVTNAFAAADTSFVLPFDFSRLVFASALGFFVFAEAPDAWTWVGAAIIVASSTYVAHRESRILRQPTPQVTPPG